MSKKKAPTYSSLLSLDNEVKKKPKPPLQKLNAASKIESSKDKRSRSRSPKNRKMKSSMKAPREEVNWDIPNRLHGDLYCKPCDAHMNSDQMWEAHIQGKRHLKNVKKGEAGDLKYDYIDEDPIMITEINADTRPIVGLEHTVEIQRLEQRPTYQCFLCSANVPTAQLLLDHMAGTKHRLAYLKEHDPKKHELIKRTDLKKGHIEPVAETEIRKHEAAVGRGKMLVKREREDYKSPPRKSYKPDLSSSKSTRSKRSPDRDPKKSQRDRSLDRFDGHSSQDHFADRVNSHHNRSDDLTESYKRSGYNDRLSEEYKNTEKERYGSSRFPLRDVGDSLLSPDDEYGRSRPSVDEDRYGSSTPFNGNDRFGRPPVDDRYGSSRPPVDDRYGSSRPPVDDVRYNSKQSVAFDRGDNLGSDFYDKYGHAPYYEERNNDRYRTSLEEDGNADLRQVLEKKKTSMEPYHEDNWVSYAKSSTGEITADEVVSGVPVALLKTIHTMNPTIFLQLALYKMGQIEIKNDSEIELLDKLSSAISSMLLELKQRQLTACPTELKEKFKESMVKHGINVTPDYQKLIEFVSQAKANSQPVSSDESSAQQLSYEGQCSNPIYLATATHLRSTVAYSSTVAAKDSGSSWQHVDSTQALSVPPSSHSKASYIPGLTLTNSVPDPPVHLSPFDLMNRQTKDILGGINRANTDSYRY